MLYVGSVPATSPLILIGLNPPALPIFYYPETLKLMFALRPACCCTLPNNQSSQENRDKQTTEEVCSLKRKLNCEAFSFRTLSLLMSSTMMAASSGQLKHIRVLSASTGVCYNIALHPAELRSVSYCSFLPGSVSFVISSELINPL